MAPATLRDVALRCGVSTATASRALNNRHDVSDITKQKVQEMATMLGYVPNTMAQGLWSGSTKTIGVVITTILSPFYAAMVDSLETQLRSNGFNIVLCSSLEDPAIELRAIKTLLQQRVDGIVLAPVHDQPEVEEFLEKNGVPYVLVARSALHVDADFVGSDDMEVGRLATNHLLERGHRQIAFLNSKQSSSAKDRFEGYRLALEEHGLAVQPDFVWSLGPGERVDGALRSFLKQDPRPTALFCFCDEIALPTMEFLKERGYKIPEDIALVGVDNLHYTSQLNPGLTTVDTHKEVIGEQAARILIGKLQGPKRTPRKINVPATLIERQSS